MIIQSYLEVKYVYIKNSGVSKARNIGYENANGELICFLDSDDEWLPNKLMLQVNFLNNNPQFDWVHANEIWIRDGIRVNQKAKHKKGGGDQFTASLNACIISPSVVMLKRSLLESFGVFDTRFTVCEDFDLWLKILAKKEIGFIDADVINKYGGHKDQLSTKFFAMDYWRIKTISHVLLKSDLSDEKRQMAIKILLKKTQVLLKGYLKHNNFENFSEIKEIENYFS